MKKIKIGNRTFEVEENLKRYETLDFIKDKKQYIGAKNKVSNTINNLTILKKYGDKYKLTTLKFNVKRKGYEHKITKKNTVYDKKLNNNVIRARSKVQEYALCNDFEYFITLTLDKEKYDRYNLDKYIKDLGQFIRDYRKKYKVDIQYLLIPEQHKDGAWHMHGLIFGIKEEHLKNFDNIVTAPQKLKGKNYYNFELYHRKFGFCSLGEIQDKEKVANYITKYLNKDLAQGIEQGNKCYYNSRGLKKAEEIKRGLLQSPLQYDYENDYIKVKSLNKEQLNDINII